MKRYHCWLPEHEDATNGLGFDADTPDGAAEAYVEHLYQSGEGDEPVRVVCARSPGQFRAVRVRVTVRMVREYTSEVIEPREEP